MPKSVDKPGPVSRSQHAGPERRSSIWDGSYPPSLAAYPKLKRYWPHRAPRGLPLLGLAPDGGCLAVCVTTDAGGLLHHLFTITKPNELAGCLLFCGPFPSGHPAWALPSIVPCGARTFLTPNTGCDRLTDLGTIPMIAGHSMSVKERVCSGPWSMPDFTICAIQCKIPFIQKTIGGIERWQIRNQRSSGFAVQSVGVYATGISGGELEPL